MSLLRDDKKDILVALFASADKFIPSFDGGMDGIAEYLGVDPLPENATAKEQVDLQAEFVAEYFNSLANKIIKRS